MTTQRDFADFRFIVELVAEAAAGQSQAGLLDTAVSGLRSQFEEARATGEAVPSADFPFAIGDALRTDEAATTALAAACSLVFLGLDILDDVADGDHPAGRRRVAARPRQGGDLSQPRPPRRRTQRARPSAARPRARQIDLRVAALI